MKKLLSIALVVIMALSVIPIGNMVDVSAATTSQQNIVGWADYYYGIKWTAQTTVSGWKGNYTYSKGSSYRLPYGQPVTKGKYIGFGVSVDDFLKATKDSDSVFYTTKSYYSGYSSNSVYYALDCSAFVSLCWGISRSTTSSIPSKGTSLGKLSSSTVNKIQIGDCLNSTSDGHVVLVTDVTYSGSTVKSVEITEQTPPQLKRTTYTVSNLVSKYSSKGYSIYRYNGTVPAPPSEKPVITSANGDNHTEVTIKWSEVSGATKYKVERRKAGDDNYSTAEDSTTKLTFTDTGLSKNQRYYYKVTAYNGSTKLGTSEPAGVYTKFDPPTIAAVSDSKLKLTWDSVAKAESYTIMRKKSGGEYSELKTVTDTSYTDSGLSASTQYYYWIKANCNVDGTSLVAKSTSSGQYTFTKAPVIKEVDDISKSEVKIIWNAVTGASSYRIDRRKAGDSNYTTIKTGLTDTFYNDTGLETGQRYYYIVYAKNSAGESAASVATGGYTKFNAPNITAEGTNKLNINWDSISYAEIYTIKRKIYNGNFEDVRKVESISYGDVGLNSGTQYFYWIQADCNVDGTNIIAKTVSKGQFTFMDRAEALSASSTSVKLGWNAVKGDSTYKYEVLRCAAGEDGFKVIATTTDTSYTDTNLSPSKVYVYRIKAFDTKNNLCCTETLEPVSVETPACNHSYNSTTVSPTCTANGATTYTCTICSDTYTVTIPSTGHTGVTTKGYDATCTENGLTDGVHCSVCNAVLTQASLIEPKGHTAENDWTTISTSENGTILQVKYCKDCKEVLESREIIDVSVNTEPTDTVYTDPVETTTATEPSTGVVEKPSESVTTDPVESTVLTETTETTEATIVTTAEPVESTAAEPTESEPTSTPVTSSQDESEPSTSTSSSNETKPTEPEDDKGLLGDVNGDGKVNVKDATLIQKFAAKITAFTEGESLRADVNGDTKINVKDATAIQKFAAKIETGFPIGKPIK